MQRLAFNMAGLGHGPLADRDPPGGLARSAKAGGPRRGERRRRGVALIWVAILGMVLIGFVGLAMDGAVVLLAGHQLQVAADAAALAGAWHVKEDPFLAREAALDIAQRNKALGPLDHQLAMVPVELKENLNNSPTGDIVLGRYHQTAGDWCPDPPCFYTDDPRPNAVAIRARHTENSITGQVPLVFGSVPLFGVEGVNVTRLATAVLVGSTGAGLLVLEEYPGAEEYCTLWLRGNAGLKVEPATGFTGAASIQVNSDDRDATCVEDAGGTLMADEINVVGGANLHPSAQVGYVLNSDAPSMNDPLSRLPAPPLVGDLGSIRKGGKYRPGYYPGGLSIQSGHQVVLEPGIYVFDGAGFRIKGDAQLTARGVMIYVRQGPVDINGSGPVVITPIEGKAGDDMRFVGVSLFQGRANTAIARLHGTPQMDMQGTLYFPRATRVDLSGVSQNFGNQLIAWSIYLEGDIDLTIKYDGRFPSPNYAVYLVE